MLSSSGGTKLEQEMVINGDYTYPLNMKTRLYINEALYNAGLLTIYIHLFVQHKLIG